MQVDDMQGLAFDEQAWAVEHFLLNDPKVQQQLFKYLILPAKDLEKEGMPSNANQDQQQSWILQKAAADYTAFVASTAQLALSICPDITVDHLQPEAAGVIVEQYAKQLGHSHIRTEKQKRRFTGFLNKIALKDSTFRHLSILTDDERKKMAMAFLQASTHCLLCADITHSKMVQCLHASCTSLHAE